MSMDEWWMYVCHQSDWTYHKKPIKFLVVKVSGMVCVYLFFYKGRGSIHILSLLRHFLWVRLRILVINEKSLEV